MSRYFIYPVLSLLLLFSCSQVNATPSDSLSRLAGLCKVWGLMKYYHPNIQKGNVDWDACLIVAIERGLSCKDYHEYNIIIDSLIAGAGPCRYSKNSMDLTRTSGYVNNIDFSWIKNDDLFKKETQRVLLSLVENYKPRRNVYIKREMSRFYLDEGIDQYYVDEHFTPDSTESLLAFFKYWNAINYFFAYKNISDNNWDDVLEEFIPKFMWAASSEYFYTTFAQVATKINDCHAFFDNKYFNHNVGYLKSAIEGKEVPIKVKLILGQTVISEVTSEIVSQGWLRPGDIVLKINGVPIEMVRNELSHFCGCSTYKTVEREIDNGIFQSYFVDDISNVDLTILDSNDSIREVNISTASVLWDGYRQPKVTFISDSIAYVNISYARGRDLRKAFREAAKTSAIIFDLRENARCSLNAIGLRARRNDSIGKVFANYYEANMKIPGKYELIKIRSYVPLFRPFFSTYRGRIVILIDENVQSAFEWQIMKLRAVSDVTLVGANTAGTDGEAESFLPQYNILTYFTLNAVLYPNNVQVQRIGIRPDIFVEPDVQAIREGRDVVLEKAIDFIQDK